jgi:hypothetical protein
MLHSVEEQFPAFRDMLCAVACVQTKEFYHFILEICMAQRTKCFLGILCYLSFSMVSAFKDDFLYPYG